MTNIPLITHYETSMSELKEVKTIPSCSVQIEFARNVAMTTA